MNVDEIRQERKYSQSFMLNMNVEDQCFGHFSEQEDDFIASQISRQFDPEFSPLVEQGKLLETQKNGFKTRTSPFTPTHDTKRKVPGDHQKPQGCKRKRTMFDNVDNPEDSSVKSQVKEMKANLGAECLIFVKVMLPSNVNSGFVLALPKRFCHSHLPLHDSTITLEDKSGEQYETKFIVQKKKSILSSGWRRFCSANKLVVGDVLLFHLVRPLKFKVYIMERHSLAEVDAALSLLKLGACTKQTTFEGNHPMPLLKDVCQGHIDQKTSVTLDSNPTLIDDACAKQTAFEGNRPMPLLRDVCQGHIDQKTSVTLDSNPTLIDDACAKQTAFEGNRPMPLLKDVCQGHIDQKTSVTLDSNPTLIDDACAKQTAFEGNRPMPLLKDVCQGHIDQKTSVTLDSNCTEIDDEYNKDFGFNILEEVGLPIPSADFEDVQNTENFTVLVNGVSINSHFSEEIRNRYYDLCCSQRSFLHDHLLESINGKLAAEIITETTNIANAIRACKLSTPHAAYVMWEKTLVAFEMLGMNVGFLRARLKQLLSLSCRTKQALIRKTKEAKLEQARVKEEELTLEKQITKYCEWRNRMLNADSKVYRVKVVAKRRELLFQEEAVSPWG